MFEIIESLPECGKFKFLEFFFLSAFLTNDIEAGMPIGLMFKKAQNLLIIALSSLFELTFS